MLIFLKLVANNTTIMRHWFVVGTVGILVTSESLHNILNYFSTNDTKNAKYRKVHLQNLPLTFKDKLKQFGIHTL